VSIFVGVLDRKRASSASGSEIKSLIGPACPARSGTAYESIWRIVLGLLGLFSSPRNSIEEKRVKRNPICMCPTSDSHIENHGEKLENPLRNDSRAYDWGHLIPAKAC
jgi:hypothetical protein